MSAASARPGADPLGTPQQRHHVRPQRLPIWLRFACATAGRRDARRLAGSDPALTAGAPMWLQRNAASYTEAVESQRLELQAATATHVRDALTADTRIDVLTGRATELQRAIAEIDALPAITSETVERGPAEQTTDLGFIVERRKAARAAQRREISEALAVVRAGIADAEIAGRAAAATVVLATELAVTRCERLRAHYGRRAAVYARGWTRRVGTPTPPQLADATRLPTAAWTLDTASVLPARFRPTTH